MPRLKQFLLAVSVLFCTLMLPGDALAVELEYYGVDVTIEDDNSVTNEIVFKFDTPVNQLDYSLDFEIEDLEYESDFEFADCGLSDRNGGSTISCDIIGMTDEKNKLTLRFTARDVIQKTDEDYRLTANYGVPFSIEKSFVIIRLPQNNILAGEGNESYSPNSGAILSDGRHIMVFWENEGLETGEGLQFSVLFTRPKTLDLFSFALYATAIMAAVAALFSVIYVKKIRGTKVAVVKSVLNRDEKRIIDILNEKGGKAGQKLLVRESDFSKAKVSRIVKNLRERDVVDIEPVSGRENRVILRLERRQKPERAPE